MKRTPRPPTTTLTVRVREKTYAQFVKKAQAYGGVSEVIRESIDAFLEDRLFIKPPVKPTKESLYHAE